VGGLPAEEPYFYRNSVGQWSGFLAAMAGNLAAALGVELAIVESNWADMATDLHTGKIDLGYMPNPTAQRAMFADFSAPLFHDTYAILARKGIAATSWADLNRPESLVGVDTGSVREEAARRLAGNAAITGFKTGDEALLAVQSGRVDCIIGTVFFALVALKKNPQIGELVVPTPRLQPAVCPAVPYDQDRRFRGVVDVWSEDNRGTGQIRTWVMAGLAKLGVNEGDLPPDLIL
jgi:polar amino acid transport system substrate-binding protein